MFGHKSSKTKKSQDPRYLIGITAEEAFLDDPLQLRQYCNLEYTREQIAVLLGSFFWQALFALYKERALGTGSEWTSAEKPVALIEKTARSCMQYRSERPKEEDLTPYECCRAYTDSVDEEKLLLLLSHAAEENAGHRIDRKAFVEGTRNFYKKQMKLLVDAMYQEMKRNPQNGEETLVERYAKAYASGNP
jgi:hypothetical protein